MCGVEPHREKQKKIAVSLCVCEGMSKRSWQIEIIQDHLEEAEETFEVLLISPESTVIGATNKAKVTIRDSGSKLSPR